MKKEKSKFGQFWSKFSDTTRELHQTDWIIIGILVLIYGVIAFTNLGSTKNPQTFYEFQSSEDEVVFTVGETAKSISKIRMYAGDINGSYNVYFSLDNQKYTNIDT